MGITQPPVSSIIAQVRIPILSLPASQASISSKRLSRRSRVIVAITHQPQSSVVTVARVGIDAVSTGSVSAVGVLAASDGGVDRFGACPARRAVGDDFGAAAGGVGGEGGEGAGEEESGCEEELHCGGLEVVWKRSGE